MRNDVKNCNTVNNSNCTSTPNSATTITISKFTRVYGGYFSTQKISNKEFKATYRSKHLRVPFSAYGSSFANALVNVINGFLTLKMA